MKMKTSLAIAALAGSLVCAAVHGADSKADVRTLSVILPETRDEFVARNPIDWRSVERGWQYALRYVHNEPRADLSFGLVLMRVPGISDYNLALYDGDTEGLSFREFDEMDASQKLKVASVAKTIDVGLAQVLYETWVRVLLRARNGDGGLASTSSQYFYVSTYAIETEHMCAMSADYRPGTTTGRVVEIGKLLRRYVQERDESKSKELEGKIRSLCPEVAATQ